MTIQSEKGTSLSSEVNIDPSASNGKVGNTKIDNKIDKEILLEFGGPVGVTVMMVFFPFLMYYFWVCLEFHEGKLLVPAAFTYEAFKDVFYDEFWVRITTDAFPTVYAAQIYLGSTLLSAIFAYVMPGPIIQGLPVPSLNGETLSYLCNGLYSWYATLALSAILHYTGLFLLTDIIDNFGPIMSVAIIFGVVTTLLTYIITVATGAQHRMSGYLMYDIFMGAPLNPRIGRLDLKIWAEIRVPWVILFYVSLSAALKQYEVHGYVSAPTAFMVMAHFLYVNACMKGEECIPTTWDIFYEKWGFMLIFWNFAGVPFTYCHATLYLAKWDQIHGSPLTFSLPYIISVYTLCLVGYYVWDTANSQKNRFRMQLAGTYIPRNTFPQLPWGTIKEPTYVRTEHGNLLLTSGWWGIARKIHYTGDLAMAISWGLIAGFESLIPYFYFVFFLAVLTHRVTRDMERCAKKYGKDWETYCERVPWIFVPGVY